MNVSIGVPDQRQAGLDQPLRQHEAIKLILWPLEQRQILPDLREPRKVAARHDAFSCPAHLVDGSRDGDGADPSLEFGNERGMPSGVTSIPASAVEIKPPERSRKSR